MVRALGHVAAHVGTCRCYESSDRRWLTRGRLTQIEAYRIVVHGQGLGATQDSAPQARVETGPTPDHKPGPNSESKNARLHDVMPEYLGRGYGDTIPGGKTFQNLGRVAR